MQQQTSDMNCKKKSWTMAAVAGFLVFLLKLIFGSGFFGSLFWGLVAFVALGFLLNWLRCRDQAEAGGSTSGATSTASDTTTAAPTAAVPSTPAPEAPASEPTPAPSASEAASPEPAAATSVLKPSTPLPGQEDLASRKGEWKYDGGNNNAAKAAETSAPAAPVEKTEASATQEVTPDYDGDGVHEGADEGTKPATLTAAREGGADNLKEIKGVGPKLEQLLNTMGFFHFDQISKWTADEIAWVNANLQGFKGRVTRDNWVEQAKVLAAGGETEFSKRVDKGDVY